MNLKSKSIISLLLTAIMIVLPIGQAKAATVAEKQKEVSDIQSQINNIQAGLQNKQDQVRTLNDQLAFMDTQISAVQSQIDLIQGQIDKTNGDIAQLNAQIAGIQASLSQQQELLKAYIVELYGDNNVSTLEMIAGSDNFSDYMNQVEYIETLQGKINENVKSIKALHDQLDAEKSDLDNQKNQLQKLQDDQNQKKQALENEKNQKWQLLNQTQGEEDRYQAMLADAQKREAAAQSEVQKMVQSLSRSGATGGYQSAGTVIGYQGNTGYSTGSHLHFTVYHNGVEVDPLPLLQSGVLGWPESNPVITQHFGTPEWNAAYSFHNGLDMSAGYGAPVHMALPGVVVKDAFMANGYGHYKIVDHGNGYMTLYGHMQ